MRTHGISCALAILLALTLLCPVSTAQAATIRNYTLKLTVDGTAYTLDYENDVMTSCSPDKLPETASLITFDSLKLLFDDPDSYVDVTSPAAMILQGSFFSGTISGTGTPKEVDVRFSVYSTTVAYTDGKFSVPYSITLIMMYPMGTTQVFSGSFVYDVTPAPTPIPVGGLSREGFTTTPAVDPVTLPQLRVAHVAEAANIRSGPGTEYPVAATLPLGAPLALAMTTGDWLQVYYNDGTALGWIHTSLTEPA